jgi:hypothetical protein
MVKPQEHKLRVARHGVGNTRARRTNTANRAPNMPMHHGHGFIPVCTISILWNSHTTPCHPSENYELQPEGHRHRTTSTTTNYELHGTGWATRAPAAQTLQTVRQTCSCTTATCLYKLVRFSSFPSVHMYSCKPCPAHFDSKIQKIYLKFRRIIYPYLYLQV